jgi:hypothetical protein
MLGRRARLAPNCRVAAKSQSQSGDLRAIETKEPISQTGISS